MNNNAHHLVRHRTLQLRSKCLEADPTKPRFIAVDDYELENKMYKRLRIILRSNGCSLPFCLMCPFPNEALDSRKIKIRTDHYVEQVRSTLLRYPKREIISVYNDGNFFAEQELPVDARIKIYELIKNYGCRYLMVESLPKFMTHECLEEAMYYLGDAIKLIVGIGLQTVSDEIRKICIRAPLTQEDFLKANALLKKFNYGIKSYIMIKPPFLLEEEAKIDAVESVIWLHQHEISDIALCPMRVARGTVLQELYDRKLYILPKLNVFSEILSQLQMLNIRVRVSIFNIESSDFDAFVPHGCERCEDKIKQALVLYNRLERVNFSELCCSYCKEQSKKDDPEIFRGLSYEERVNVWLDSTK